MGHKINLAQPVELLDDERLAIRMRWLTQVVAKAVCDCGLQRCREVYDDPRLWTADHEPTCRLIRYEQEEKDAG